MTLALVIGGTRSGKSAYAERLAESSGMPVRYVATADAADASMAARIAVHVARRSSAWTTVDAGDELAASVAGANGDCLLIDGLGTWIAGVLHRAGAFDAPTPDRLGTASETVRSEIASVVSAARSSNVIVVAEEAGHGLLPAEAASRAWLDLLGETTQLLATAADRVELVVAGRPIALSAAPATTASPDVGPLRRHGDRDVRAGDADHAVTVLSGGPPGWLRGPLHDALDSASGSYPDEAEATSALAALHGRDASEIVVTNGAAEALWLLPAALRPRLAACVHPAFTEAEAALHAHSIPVVRVLRDPEAGFALDPAAVPEQADLVIAGNPVSPSGTLDPASALLALRRPGRTVVVDEAFMNLVPGAAASLAGERLDDVIVVRSLTKALGVPGLRVGYAIAAAPLAARLNSVRPPWSANSVALAALTAAAAHPAELAAIAEQATADRADLATRLTGIAGLRTWPSATNYCLLEVADGPAVAAALRAQGIAVRPAASFPGLDGRHLRVTARDPEANARLAVALAEAVA